MRIISNYKINEIDNGLVWIGKKGLNPFLNPIDVYLDRDCTLIANQPLTILDGSIIYNDSVVNIFCKSGYSITIKDTDTNDVFKLDNGLKLLTEEQYSARKNFIVNGDFQINSISVNKLVVLDQYNANATGFSIGKLSKNTTLLGPTYSLSATLDGYSQADGYARINFFIENVDRFADETITVSFYATKDTKNVFATSFTQYFYNDPNRTGISPQIHFLNEDWTKHTITIKIPNVSGVYGAGGELKNLTALFFHIWLGAGQAQSQEIGNFVNYYDIGTMSIADLQINIGADTNYQRLNPDRTLRAYQRYSESTLWNPITYIASGANNVIPGFRFRTLKRIIPATSDIILYSESNRFFPNKINHVGVGNIDVTGYNDISEDGLGSINLATNTVAGGIYQYYWDVDTRLTL